VGTVGREIVGTVVGRWYVTAFGVVFASAAIRHMGWRRTLLYTVVAVAVGALAENGSVHLGVPYTRYAFNPHLRGKEIFVGDVPLMVPLSYTFMGYFAFASGRLLASGPRRTRGRRVVHEYLLGVLLAVWALWLFDPVSRLGNRWFLGDVFHYAGPGFWFGLPLGSQLGFTLTAAVLVGFLTWMGRQDADLPVDDWRRHPHLVALATYHGQLIWLGTVACILGATELGTSALLIWIPAAAMTTLYWGVLRLLPAPADPAVARVQLATAAPLDADGHATAGHHHTTAR
jgi:uncharacterized membrane protein